MKINIEIDTKQLEQRVDKYIRNLAYSTEQAINDTAKQVQVAVQDDMKKVFTFRSKAREGFLLKQIKMFEWADVKKNKLYAEIGVANDKERLLLPLFETGGKRKPVIGKNVAVPVIETARRGNIKNKISDSLTFENLNLEKHRTASGKVQWKGSRKKRIFIIKGSGVYKRAGRKKNSVIKPIYLFKKSVKVNKKISVFGRSREIYTKFFHDNFNKRFYKLDR